MLSLLSKRMDDAYNYAISHNFDYWTTVLSVSPHKNSQWINEIGATYPQEQTKFLFSDFKKNNGYLKSVQMASSYNLYRQSYCGCVYSYQDMLKRKRSVKIMKPLNIYGSKPFSKSDFAGCLLLLLFSLG
ncbi:epoxyqueuosine reductase QueH [Coprobacillaceae bacterium CR2/5/TPMF4]|nr:epoxyqueuosine reductase QueH [Coprobacillaceae bacterium CR2/5/TPMF4]